MSYYRLLISNRLRLLITMIGIVYINIAHSDDVFSTYYTLEAECPQPWAHLGNSNAARVDTVGDIHSLVVVRSIYSSMGGQVHLFRGPGFECDGLICSPNQELVGDFGASVEIIPDIDDDRQMDIAVGDPEEDSARGGVYLFSGISGNFIQSLSSPQSQAGGYFGSSIAIAGDVNCDSIPDIIVGARGEDGPGADAGRAYVFSGRELSLLLELRSPNAQSGGQFGCSVSEAGDIDNDGYDDFIVGANHEYYGSGRAYIYSGRDGSLLHALQSGNPSSDGRFGHSVSQAGDVDADGFLDVIVGAEGEPYAEEFGRAYVFSGRSGRLLLTLNSPHPVVRGNFGKCVSGAGDLNENGYDDVIVGAWNETFMGLSEAGRVYVFDGYEGHLLFDLGSPNAVDGGGYGTSVTGGKDVDFDGHPDLIIGADDEHGGADKAGRGYILTSTMALWGNIDTGQLILEWTPHTDVSEFWVFGTSNQAHFIPCMFPPYDFRVAVLPANSTGLSSSTGVGNPNENWTYLVIAVDASEQELARSNRVGEFDYLVNWEP